jgi:hypothetical protein
MTTISTDKTYKELFIVKTNECFIIHNEDNKEICRIYKYGFNDSKLTDEQAFAYASLFAKSRKMVEYVCELHQFLGMLKECNKI